MSVRTCYLHAYACPVFSILINGASKLTCFTPTLNHMRRFEFRARFHTVLISLQLQTTTPLVTGQIPTSTSGMSVFFCL